MAGSVIERISTEIEHGIIKHDDRPSSFEAAEKLAARRLDRRRAYAIIGGEVREAASWSQACSGCYEGRDISNGTGSGCSECGYTGRRKQGWWAPIRKGRE